MKTITKYTSQMFAIIAGIVLSISVSGQIAGDLRKGDNLIYKSHFTFEKPARPSFNGGFGAGQPVYKSTQGSFPQEIHHFYWDITTIWMADYNKMVSYDNYGTILTELIMNANTGDTSDRTVYTYDNEGRETEILYQNWSNGNWENNIRQIHTYDVNDNPEVFLEQMWQGGSWATNWGNKYVYTYDVNNHITEEILQLWDANNNNWSNYDRYFYSYDVNGYLIEHISQWWDDVNNVWYSVGKQIFTYNGSGVIVEVINQSWDNTNSVWVNSYKYIDIVWYDWSGNLEDSEVESYTELAWNSGIWENYSKFSATFDAYGSSVLITQYYFNGNWVNSSKQTSTFDAHGNFIEYTYEFWVNNAWVIDIGEKNLLTYNGNDVIQRIMQSYDHANMVWFNTMKEEYSDFIYTQGIYPVSSTQDGINLFPNPVSETLNIYAVDNSIIIQKIEIVSLSGQIVFEMQASAVSHGKVQINMTDLKEGVYFVRLQHASGITVGKVIVY